MKIHSDILTPRTISEAVPEGCYLAEVYSGRAGGFFDIVPEGSRKRERAYSVRLSGSGKRPMVNLPDKSATWDEWGIFIAALYEIDPHAIVGVYTGRNNFIEVTMNEHERVCQYREDLLATHSAPWLYA